MANIDRIVKVAIALRTAGVASLSFSDLMLFGQYTADDDSYVNIITDADQLVEDFHCQPVDPIYKAAQAVFSQIPHINRLYIGRDDTGQAPPIDLPSLLTGGTFTAPQQATLLTTLQALDDGAFSIAVNGLPRDTGEMDFTDIENLTEAAEVIETGLGSGVTCSWSGMAFIIQTIATGDTTSLDFAGAPADGTDISITLRLTVATGATLRQGGVGTTRTVTENLIALANENNDWYAICDVHHIESRAVEMGEWAEAREKLFVTVLSNPNNTSASATDNTSTAAQLKQKQLFRTAWWYNPDPAQFPDCALIAKMFTKYPGQETYANQRLSAVNYTFLSETIYSNLFNKNGNTFEPFRNIAITQNGKVAGGEWIDIIRFRDWLCEEIKIRIFQQMVDNRIPYTDPGIAIIRTRLQEALDMGVIRGGIAPPEVNSDGDLVPSYTISVPLSVNISANQKATRVLQDVYFTARIAGAIHVVEIQGTLTYENLPVSSPVLATATAGRSAA